MESQHEQKSNIFHKYTDAQYGEEEVNMDSNKKLGRKIRKSSGKLNCHKDGLLTTVIEHKA